MRSRRYRFSPLALVGLCSVGVGKARPSVDTALICFAEWAFFAAVAVIVRQTMLNAPLVPARPAYIYLFIYIYMFFYTELKKYDIQQRLKSVNAFNLQPIMALLLMLLTIFLIIRTYCVKLASVMCLLYFSLFLSLCHNHVHASPGGCDVPARTIFFF